MNVQGQTRYFYPIKQICGFFLPLFLRAFLTGGSLIFPTVSLSAEPAAGMLDLTFDSDGKVTTNFGGDEIANAVALQTDGKIVTAGFTLTPGPGFNPNFAVARHNSDGSLDISFDSDGKVTTDFLGFFDIAEAIAIQPDGKIIVAGKADTSTPDNPQAPTLFALARYNADGSLDSGFDGDGKLTFSFINGLETAYDLAIQPDGKIIVVGSAQNMSGAGMALARLNLDGSFDGSFGTGGKLYASLGAARGNAQAVALQTDGRIVIGGYASSPMFDEDFLVARFNSNGQFDTTFGTNGITVTDMSGGDDDAALDIALQADGKIITVGYAIMQQGDFAMVRYNTNGSLDANFGSGGKVITAFGSEHSGAHGVVIQPDGKIVSVGRVSVQLGMDFDFALTRHTAGGVLDSSFGSNGRTTTSFADRYDQANAVVLQPDGKIIAAGVSQSLEFVTDMAVARYSGDSVSVRRAPFDFDGDGKTDISIFRPSDGSWWYLRSSDTQFRVFSFGVSTDRLVPGDFTGDGKTDIAVFRPSTGFWYVQRSEDNSFFSFPFGMTGDIPTPSDYDGDGKTDAAVFRPSTGTWFILNSSGSGISIVNFGTSEDKPVPADFDGDGKADIAIFRPGDGSWWHLQSSNAQFKVYRFGVSSDKAVPGDYTGDGKADIAVFRPSTGEWFFQRSEDNSYYSFPFGTMADIPTSGDYDGDGRFDAAVFRPSNSTWFVQRSSAGTLITNFGTNGDIPVPSVFVQTVEDSR